MKCPGCGADVDTQSVYCHKCGGRLDTEHVPDDQNLAESAAATIQSDAGGPATPPESEPPAASSPMDRLRGAAGADNDVEEKELWEGSYSAKAMAGAFTLSLLATIGLVVLGFVLWKTWFWWTVLIATGVLWLYQIVVLIRRRLGVAYRLTTHRFFHESGILVHTTDLIEVIDMDDITYRQNLIDRLFGVGSISIISSDRSHPDLQVHGIENVRDVAAMLQDARHAERIRRGLHIERI